MIPTKYHWLTKLDQLPRTIQIGLGLYGITEVVGRGSNRTIISWRDILNQAGVPINGFSDDDIPWCGLAAAFTGCAALKCQPASWDGTPNPLDPVDGYPAADRLHRDNIRAITSNPGYQLP